ncbi:MAG: DUF86 domain-containing protein [Planctomycetes bacterium]|nr:DUF86 domain-containing protein [Planctomycetota bacterium]
MSADDRIYVRHILDCIERIQDYTKQGKQAFQTDRMMQDAVVRNIEIIGEAVKRLSNSAKDKHPSIPWGQIARMRDKVIHHYFGLDLVLVWEVVAQHVEPLRKETEALLKELESSEEPPAVSD